MIIKFTTLANFFAQNRRARWGLFLGAAALAILITGYHFGTFDQFAHIPFLKAMADPTLYPHDPFLQMRHENYSFFWNFFAWVYQLDLLLGNSSPLILGTVMLLVHYATTTLFFFAIWELSLELFRSPTAALLAVLGFIIPRFSFGSFPVLEFSLLNRTAVLPALLLAILFYLRDRRRLAFLLVGLLFNFHVISSNFVIGMFTFDSLLRLRQVGWRNFLLQFGLFLLGAAPVLIWKATSLSSEPLIDRQWLDVISQGMVLHLFFIFKPSPYILLSTTVGMTSIISFLVARRGLTAHPHRARLLNLFTALMLVLCLEILTAYFVPVTLILQLQIVRAGIFMAILAFLYWCAYVAHLMKSGALDLSAGAWLGITSLLSPFAFLPLVVNWARQRFPNRRRQIVLNVLFSLLMLAGVVWAGIEYHLFDYGLYPYGKPDAWMDTQLWARDHTPLDAVFITPPENWGIYDTHWRVFSERSTVVTLADLLMVALVPEYTPTWIERFDQLAPGVRAQFDGDYFANVERTHIAFYTLTEAELLAIGGRYGAEYLVMQKPNRRAFPVLYENSQYTIYGLSPVAAIP